MEKWLKEYLRPHVKESLPTEIIDYALTLTNPEELRDIFSSLLDLNKPKHQAVLDEITSRILSKNSHLLEIKPEPLNAYQKKKEQKARQAKEDSPTKQTTKSRKARHTNFFDQEVVLLKGRHHCDCEASKHKLINNCCQCGRIICEQEGSGPCLCCGNLVCSEEELRLIESQSKKGSNLKKSLLEQQRPKGWEEALAQRNRLLEYDRTSEKRTTVIDDESDYFTTTSVWLSDAERKKLSKMEAELHERKHAGRMQRKMTFDFVGREVIDEPEDFYGDEVLQEIAKIAQSSSTSSTNQFDKKGNRKFDEQNDEIFDDIHPGLDGPAPTFDSSCIQPMFVSMEKPDLNQYSRVQDRELLEISDMKKCMSMHQPWASLLVAGIKKHEGRTWYTAHRGRLWIAATAKPVDMNDVKTMEHFYRALYNDESIKFPSQYPSGCLLGYVSVSDCLPQEDYRQEYPNGESDSPYVFVCSDPQELPIRFPVKGAHKIYTLDPKIHTAAVKSLQRIARIQAEED